MELRVSKKRLLFAGLLTAFCLVLLAANMDLFIPDKRHLDGSMLALVMALLLGG